MISSPLAAFLARRNIHYGWIVVGVTFLTMMVTAGAMGAPGVLIVPLEREFGWDNAQISSAMALRLLLFGLFGPFAAAFMNRFGLRRVMIWAAALIGGGLLASLAMTQVWQLIVLWGLVVGIGSGLTAVVLAATGGDALVHGAARPGGRAFVGKLRHRPARFSAADGVIDGSSRLAGGVGFCLRHADAGRAPCFRADARPAERS
jgi:MFS family permease